MLNVGMEACPGFKLMKRIGKGGFGEVWQALGPDGRNVALKFMDCRQKTSSVVVNEIKLLLALRELRHPHLIQLLNINTGPNFIILVMELAEGSLNDLHYIYQQDFKTHIPPKVLCQLLTQAAEALDFLAKQKLAPAAFHRAGLQHCDVKPSNILLLNNSVKVADFGLSGPLLLNERRDSIIGTPPYAAPELYSGKASERTDQFGLAVSYVELRTGKWPFKEKSIEKLKIENPDLSMLPLEEQHVISRALHNRWLDRWPSCVAMMEALTNAVNHVNRSPATTKPNSSAAHVLSSAQSYTPKTPKNQQTPKNK